MDNNKAKKKEGNEMEMRNNNIMMREESLNILPWGWIESWVDFLELEGTFKGRFKVSKHFLR